MCEMISAFSKAFVDWAPELDTMRLSTRDQDDRQLQRLQKHGRHVIPSEPEEDRASAILEDVYAVIQSRFGVDPVVARYIVCDRAINSGKPIEKIAEALVTKLSS